MTHTSFTLLGETIKPGSHAQLELTAPASYGNAVMAIPVYVFHGKKPGPCLFVSGAIHGDEINGAEIIRRLLKSSALKSIQGTLIAIPVVNMYGFMYQSRYLPDRRDLNRAFPGNKTGSLTSRLAHLFMNEIVKKCNYGIDLHSGALHRSNLPQIRINLATQHAERLAKAFNVPVILNANFRDGSLRQAANEMNIPILLYEAGEALRFDDIAIRLGVKGILNVMREINMLNHVRHKTAHIQPRIARASSWIRATKSGIMHPYKDLGKAVSRGEVIAVIADPFSREELEIIAPNSGIIIGRNNLPLVNEGEALFHVANFEEVEAVAYQVSEVQYENSDDWMDEF
jgi:predicted deacylase